MTETIATALVAARKDMPAVPKSSKADIQTKSGHKFSYSYASLDSIIDATKGVLHKHGLTIVQLPVSEDGRPALKTTILHVSGESISSTMPLLLAGQDMQQLGSAITYARRYAWAAALGIASEHDDDAQSTVGEPSEPGRVRTGAASGVEASAAEPDASPTGTFPIPDGIKAELDARVEPADGGRPGEVVVEFGKHKGKKLSECPRAYVEWLAGSSFEPTAATGRRVKAAAAMFLEAA